ncbi:hypothetical protein LHK_01746 [Laribacter hongkongensis HLHK9]|uniref:Uncharacterized protein n=1 Tax=Laribacter hongkongensis (strain HLHK9) TaxID=557598 RepID=C1D8E0_LARHH|nr:hypothetical protein LHK_01746 [Laribacter hongkongensis HLHK9]
MADDFMQKSCWLQVISASISRAHDTNKTRTFIAESPAEMIPK